MKTNNDNELIDSSKEPVVDDDLSTANELSPILIDDDVSNQNKNNSSIEGEICDAQLKTNNDNEMLDPSKEPVVHDDLIATKELTPILIDDVLTHIIIYLPRGYGNLMFKYQPYERRQKWVLLIFLIIKE